jgi:DNA-directed RNA polymerase specialized sigma24 family protein
MAVTILHLVNDQGEPVETDIRVAVEAAFRHVMLRFPQVDEALLAELAESVAASMGRRRREIVTPKQYAQMALCKEVRGWLQEHEGFEIAIAETEELERLAGGTPAGKGVETAESEIFFAQLRKHLTERDRHILVLIEQDLDKPPDIAAALDISYEAAAKALQRVRARVAGIINGTRKATEVNADLPTHTHAKEHLK